MTAVDDGTEVVVETNIDVTGKPAQFGRGVMADVGASIIDKFADCLSRRLGESDDDAAAGDDAADAAGAAASGDEASDATGDDDADDAVESADAGDAGVSEVSSGGESEVASAAAVAAGASAAATTPSSAGPRRVAAREPEVEALDVLDVMADSPVKKAVPLLAALTVIGLIVWLVRRGRD